MFTSVGNTTTANKWSPRLRKVVLALGVVLVIQFVVLVYLLGQNSLLREMVLRTGTGGGVDVGGGGGAGDGGNGIVHGGTQGPALISTIDNVRAALTASNDNSGRKNPLSGMDFLVPVGESRTVQIFMHIPKTAGTALSSTIERSAKKTNKRFEQIWTEPKTKQDVDRARASDIMFGHQRFGVHTLLPPNVNFTYVVFFRNPLERIVSHYFYHKNTKYDPWHYLANDNSLEQWIGKSDDAHDLITQFLSGLGGGYHRIVGALADPLIAISGVSAQSAVAGRPKPNGYKVTDEHFERAKYNLLNHVSFVGFTERFEESLHLLRGKFGGLDEMTFRAGKVGTKPGLETLPEATIKALLDHTTHDRKLFAMAEQIFDRQIEEFGGADALKRSIAEYAPVQGSYVKMKREIDVTKDGGGLQNCL
eukprot:TRINITY_DN107_c5_g1_i1.p1 TRINITY_DN107_c5_g1~~TRINITY_DN107_c5_g1_i1.p1  ORF type:complete len:420 (-),score=104.91 TRINITY_DN107_c5_g1_i1:65-1324(-)